MTRALTYKLHKTRGGRKWGEKEKKISIAPDKTVVEERGWWGDGIGRIDVVEGLIELAFPFHHCVLLVPLFFSFLLSRNQRRWDFTWGDNVGCFVHLLSAPVGSKTGGFVAVVVFDVESCALGEVSFLPLIFLFLGKLHDGNIYVVAEHLPNWLSIFISWSASGTGKEIFFDFGDGWAGWVTVVAGVSSGHCVFWFSWVCGVAGGSEAAKILISG